MGTRPHLDRPASTDRSRPALLLCLLVMLTMVWAVPLRAAPPADASRHWAFQPPRPVAPPAVSNVAWPQTPIDRFILARLESAGIPPAPPADPRTLLRRLSFDLTGLPPTAADVDAFASDLAIDRPAALARWIDRLLVSPQYGERWGRHWLDVARYSDTKGYVYGREERRFVHAASYRDWVIQAFNRDLPYDRFLELQIAADQLVPPSSPDLAAMGFITLGRRFLGVTHDIIDDRIDVVTRTTLALTVTCARCHDHKYDPIPTDDYYSLYGVFHGSDDRQLILAPTADPEAVERQKKFTAKHAERLTEANARLRARIADYLAAQLELNQYPEEGFEQILTPDDIIPHSVRRWRDYLRQTRGTPHPIFAPWHRLSEITPADGPDFATRAQAVLDTLFAAQPINPRVVEAFKRPVTRMRDVATRYGELFRDAEAEFSRRIRREEADSSPRPSPSDEAALAELHTFLHSPDSPTTVRDSAIVNIEYYLPTSVTEELGKLQADVDRRWIDLGLPAALVLSDRSGEPNPRVFRRGSPSQPGPEVPRQFLGILAGADRRPFQHGSGRLELARAITAPSNPLTARVLVNRVWQHHFGVGLVGTPSDFGLRAPAPSHPELLDWLALRFMEDGWSLKSLHRMILLSAVYQTAHRTPPAGDPEQRLLSAFPGRRLEFEQIRDGMLAASGELNPELGGKPAELLDASNRRRTVYALVDRQFLPGVLRTFDFANPDLHVAVRHETTVPQQGLFFLNGPFAAQRARELARKTAGLTPADRVRSLHQRLFQRPPTTIELEAGLRFVEAADRAASNLERKPDTTVWSHGSGEYDEATRRLRSFKALPHFTGTAWQGAAAFPGGETGWAQLTAEGGHPGNTRAQGCVRRWTAPRDLTVSISGTLVHEPSEGDGVRGFLLASREGVLQSATVHHGKAELAATLRVQAGDTIDFLVDIGGSLGYDQFLWNPVIVAGSDRWEARTGFSGPGAVQTPLAAWEQYAQVLLLTNEFAFVD
jgi:hypothetical protein